MEPLGLGVGIAGLAGAFTACIDCFEYVQLGRQFGQDYGKCILKLDAARLRISRWGVAMGLGPEPHARPEISASDEELAQSLLEQIQQSFEDAERISERFKKHTSTRNPDSDDLLVYNSTSDVDPEYKRLHLTMRELALKRQKGTSIRKKTAWALYEKKRFTGIIEDVVGFTDELLSLFPATQDDQRELCKTELSAIDKSQDLALVRDAACREDQMLSAEITKELEKRGHSVTDWRADGSSKMWIGDKNAFGVVGLGHNAARFTVSDKADIHVGNVNEGK